MFRTHEIKDAKRGAKKRIPPDRPELFDEHPDERTLPYFSVVPEQIAKDFRYLQLRPGDRGLFWVLVVHVLWRDGGRCVRHSAVIAKRMGIPEECWAELERQLLELKILELSPDGCFLVQPELRGQYLMTLASNNAKRN